MPKYYRVVDRLQPPDLDRLGLRREQLTSPLPSFRPEITLKGQTGSNKLRLVAIRTGQFREPRAGEWYLSGAWPQAWRAPNDLSTKYHILRLAITQTTITKVETEIEL